MKIHLISPGNKMPDWVNTAYDEFAKRLNQECTLNLIEITAPNRKQNNSSVIKEKEAELIRAKVPSDTFIICLDEKGKEFTTVQLSEHLQQWLGSGRDVCLIIGGADGLDDSIKQQADLCWSLSKLTLPHAMVRVVVAEQIYRAWSVYKNHPYHRA